MLYVMLVIQSHEIDTRQAKLPKIFLNFPKYGSLLFK